MGSEQQPPIAEPASLPPGSSSAPIAAFAQRPPPEPVGGNLFTVGTLVYTASGLVLLFVWLLWGDFALSMRDRSVGPLTEKFLLANGANNTLKQLLTSTIPTVIALILSPIVSYKSDRMRSRWGRRIPFLIYPTPVAGLAMIGIAFSPQMGVALYKMMGNTPAAGQTLQLAAANYTIGIFTVLWIVFEVAVIVSGAVFGGLINDVVPRSVLGRFFGFFRAISLYDGILFNAILFKHAAEHFTLMFALVGVLFGGGFLLMCLKVKEGQYPPPPPYEVNTVVAGRGFLAWLVAFITRFVAATVTYFRECFAEPYYLLLFAMFTFGALTFRPINDFTIRYASQLNMADSDYGCLVAVSYLVSLTIAFPLGMFVDRIHALRMAMLSLVLYVVTALYGSLYVHDAFTFGVALVAHTILSGTFFTCSASLGQALYPRSKFSQYASAGGIVTSIIVLFYGPSIGFVLDRTNNNYHLTFWAGLILSSITLLLTIAVYFKFKQNGGTQGYLAPGDVGVAPTRLEKPAHMWKVLGFYFGGAAVGLTVGYIGSYLVQSALGLTPGVGLWQFPQLLLSDADIRGYTLVGVATSVIPCGALGLVAGNRHVRRTRAAVENS